MDAQPYRPSNGTEGDIFISTFCSTCTCDSEDNPCDIQMRSMAFDVEDPQYPKEWIRTAQGPSCTAYAEKGTTPRCLATKDMFNEQKTATLGELE